MPKPLYRYEPATGDLVDGALFCLAHGTDPEIFLVIEAHKKGDSAEWRYALAQFSDLEVHARYKGKDVWEGGKILDPENGKEYRASFTPIDGGKKLEVRGYLGPFWRTQTWTRVQ